MVGHCRWLGADWFQAARGGQLAAGLPERLQAALDPLLPAEDHWLLWSGGVLVIAVLGGWLLAGLLFRALGRWASKTDSLIDDAIALHMRRQPRGRGA